MTYTQNWPHEPLIGLKPTTGAVMWSIVSVILLLAGIGALVWFYASRRDHVSIFVQDHEVVCVPHHDRPPAPVDPPVGVAVAGEGGADRGLEAVERDVREQRR